ncbi:MAG: hypothetical protein JRN06_03085 [Nitrososphaerota archaeon]|nr:hypothetical protein [Nitrososphaerota archaeon]MDG7023157.1 hypothetical protein [Nitrososphaerota archaeon]
MRNNKDVLTLQREEEAKLFLVALQLKNQVGAVADVTGRLEEGRFNLLSAFMSTPDPDGFGNFSFFAESAKRGVMPADLRSVLEKSKFVAEIRIKQSPQRPSRRLSELPGELEHRRQGHHAQDRVFHSHGRRNP